MKKVLAAMSGGVDSSVAALLLKEKGYEVTGVTLCLGVKNSPQDQARCCGPEAIEDARKVCAHLGIAHYVLDYGDELEQKVIAKFIDAYSNGSTPNPCIDCNRFLKFGSLLERARIMNFDFLATGHYAMIEKSGSHLRMKKPRDENKDQTYFLYTIRKEDLGVILFPLAPHTKQEVRTLAQKAGLPVAQKPESQDICFVTENSPAAFLAGRGCQSTSGPITDKQGRILGQHKGIAHYTIGQRQGLGISHKTPLYVTAIDAGENRISVGEKKDLKVKGLIVGDLNVLSWPWPKEVQAKIRYRKKEFGCMVSGSANRTQVVFAEEQEAVAPGQAVVFYDNDIVLGGGRIEETF